MGCDACRPPRRTPWSDFNPRTHVGCDSSRCRCRRSPGYFNPRTHVGCDVVLERQGFGADAISIHAPTWGATRKSIIVIQYMTDFNPRTHVGCDIPRQRCHLSSLLFQSTHPRGVRPNHVAPPEMRLLFQSTHPRGVRREAAHLPLAVLQFQSTHPRGVRPPAGNSAPSLSDFNPRTHVGCDLFHYLLLCLALISIHAPTWGATSKFMDATSDWKFQSTHPRGVRP